MTAAASWRRLVPLLMLLVPVVVLAQAFGSGGSDVEGATMRWLLYLILVVGLWVFVGNSGILSFGHVSFVGIGAYASAILTLSADSKSLLLPDLPGFLAGAELSTAASVLVAAGVCFVAGAFASVALMRLAGIAASLATLALLIITQNVLTNWKAVTGGSGTLTGVPTDLSVDQLLVWAIAAIVIAFAYQQTRNGVRLRAAREDEVAASSVGIRVRSERRLAFALSAAMMGAGGALFGHYLGAFGPNQFFLEMTFLTLAMLVIGGIRSLAGAVVGATAISALVEVFDRWEADQAVAGLSLGLPTGTRQLAIALLMLVILMVRPRGLTDGRELGLPRWPALRRRDDHAPA